MPTKTFALKSVKKRPKNSGGATFLVTPPHIVMFSLQNGLHHAAHSRSASHRHGGLLFGLVHDEAFGGEEQSCDGGSVL